MMFNDVQSGTGSERFHSTKAGVCCSADQLLQDHGGHEPLLLSGAPTLCSFEQSEDVADMRVEYVESSQVCAFRTKRMVK